MKRINITAHSGCLGTVAGSLKSIKAGFDCGADITEIDIRMCGSTLVLSHDKTETGKAYVTLSEAFDLLKSYPEKKINLDIKEPINLSLIEELANDKGVFSQIFLTGINEKFMSFAKKSAIPYYLNFGKKNFLATNSLYIKYIIYKTKKYGAIGINLNKCNCNEMLVKMFNDAGLSVSVWTIKNIDSDLQYIKMMPDNITCINPDEVIPLIGSLKN